jgi:phosphoadenosine phosphosulfate reductase
VARLSLGIAQGFLSTERVSVAWPGCQLGLTIDFIKNMVYRRLIAMGAIRLGRMDLRWCGACNRATHRVELTPPGDIRPAMKNDLRLLRECLDAQYGPGCSERLIPHDKVVILNSAPAEDRMDEVVVDGSVAGALRYDVTRERFSFMPRPYGAKYIQDTLTKGFVVIDDGAIDPILKSSNAMGPGILDVHPDVQVGDDVIVRTKGGLALATGQAKMSGLQMRTNPKGVAVRVRWSEPPERFSPKPGGQDWKGAIEANRRYMDRLVRSAQTFIKDAVRDHDRMDVAVSYSGGKDSLATLGLVLSASVRPKVIFVDTGLEFPETHKNVRDTVTRYGLELATYDATGAFWHAIKHFGPPAKDFRWCCKTCKLGPTSLLIKERFPKGVLAFIGQRGKESEQRYRKPNLWENPWVPGQTGASPIQDWTALEVWLYIYREGLEYNPLYDEGLDRIGCWLCPSQSLSERSIVSRHPDFGRWEAALREYAKSRGLSEDWVRLWLSRWRSLPGSMTVYLKEHGISPTVDGSAAESRYRDDTIHLAIDGPGADAISAKTSGPIDLERAKATLPMLGEVVRHECGPGDDPGALILRMKDGVEAKLTSDGIKVTGTSDPARVRLVFDVAYKGMYCVACGVCVGRCQSGALAIDPHTRRIRVDEKRCLRCGSCLGKCPVLDFQPR